MKNTLVRIVCLVIAAALCGAATITRAQEADTPSLVINQLDASAYPDIRAVVTALDPRGVPVQGLTPAQFQAFESGAQLQIVDVASARDESVLLSVVIVIDVSGSMQGEPLAQAKRAATEFVNSLGPNESATVVAFSAQVTTVVPLTTDRTQLTNGIAGLQAAGGTALFEAVQTSAFIAASSASARSAVIFLTDGQNDAQGSSATRDGSLAAARGGGAPMYTIGFGGEPDTAYLQQLADLTRGSYSPATTASVSAVYAGIGGLLRSQYVVTVRGAGAPDGTESTLQLIALVGTTPAAATATYRRGAAAGAPPPAAPSDAATGSTGDDGGTGSAPLYVFGGVLAAAVVAALGVLAVRLIGRQRLHRAQLAIVAPNVARAAAQPLPRRHGVQVAAGGAPLAVEIGTGRLIDAHDESVVHELGAGPAVIGTSRRHSTIVLPHGEDVAPEHVRIWLRDGRYLLHHVGGMSRKTYVNNHEADWVILEPGDEIRLGKLRFTFEE